jgi:uncharacterized protein YjiS (DUF1127 family)
MIMIMRRKVRRLVCDGHLLCADIGVTAAEINQIASQPSR